MPINYHSNAKNPTLELISPNSAGTGLKTLVPMNEAILEQFCPPMVLTEPELGWRCRDIATRVFELVQTCLEKSVYAF